MIRTHKGSLVALTGGVRMPQRVQRPSVIERKDRGQHYFYFRYRHDELRPDGTVKTTRRFHTLGPSKGANAITRKQAELERDRLMLERNSASMRCETTVAEKQPIEVGAILFGKLAELWFEDYVENPKVKLAQPTRDKYTTRLQTHILPRWKHVRIGEMRAKDILDWLQETCTSWYMMIDLRNIMSGVFTRAQEWEILPDVFPNPLRRVRVGKKWIVRPDRILTTEQTLEVFSRLKDPHLLVCETCISTGTRISEAVGLQLKHVDLEKGTIRIQQRNCRGDIDEPKTKGSKRVLALGTLVDRVRDWIDKHDISKPDDWIFFQQQDRTLPMWDSGIRKALKKAAKDANCDFLGFGLHSFRRANITLRQEVGASAIEASKIAGHSSVNMTGDYTIVQLARQEELTRAIQEKMCRTSPIGMPLPRRSDNAAS